MSSTSTESAADQHREDPPHVRIFVSSPGDVAEERAVALSVIRRLQGLFQGRLVLVPILWEREPLLATAGFQQEIDRRAAPSATDVAIFILWSRMGSPLSRDFILEDGRRPTGTEWEFEDALRGQKEHEVPHLLVYRKRVPPRVEVTDPNYEKRRSDFEAVEHFFRSRFQNAVDLSFTGSYHGYGDSSQFGEKLEQHLTKLLAERGAQASTAPTWHGSPFRGLESFEAEHAPIFFGRTQAIQEVRQALTRQVAAGRAFVLVLGRSGNGKSSLARAGLLPMIAGPWLVEPDLEGGGCRRAIVVPGAAPTPMEALAAALLAEDALPDLGSHGAAKELAGLFTESPKACVSQVRGALHRIAAREQSEGGLDAPPPARLLLLVDQFEELFAREGLTEADRTAFADVLDALARSRDVYVIATLRSDFYPAFSKLDKLMALKDGEGHYDLSPVDAAQTAQIIRGPAHVAGLAYEVDAAGGRRLDEVLLAEVARSPDALPLLEYALTQLEENKRGGLLTFAAYEAMGGLDGAIASRAEAEWAALPEHARQAFPAVMRGLVEVTETRGGTVSRRRAPRAEVTASPGAEDLVDRFVRARLLVAEGDGEGARVAVAHEALLRTWPRMAERIEAEAELLRIRSRVRSQAMLWDQEGREPSLLLAAGRPLEEARLLGTAGFDLTRRETDYVAASASRTALIARLRRAAVTLITALAVGLFVLTLFALAKKREADASARAKGQALEEATSERNRARSVALAIESTEASARSTTLALLLANEAVRAAPTHQSLTALLSVLAAPREKALLAHGASVEGAEFSPDGAVILTACTDHTARLWTPEGTATHVLRGHEGPVHIAHFSPDGRFIVTGSEDATARVWDRDGGEHVVLRGHDREVTSASFSSDGNRIVTASLDGTARIWDPDGRVVAILRHPKCCLRGAAFSPDGKLIVTAPTSPNAQPRIWTSAGVEIAVLRGHEGDVNTAVFSPDGAYVLTASDDGTVRLWDLAGVERCRVIGRDDGWGTDNEESVRGATFSPDGTHIASWLGDGTFRLQLFEVWPHGGIECTDVAVLDGHSVDTRTDGFSLRGHGAAITDVRFSPDGARIATASRDNTVCTWDLQGRQRSTFLGHELDVTSAVFSPDGALVLTSSEDGTARLWAPGGGEVLVFEHSQTGHASFSGDGSRLLTSAESGVRLWDRSGHDVTPTWLSEQASLRARFVPGTDRLWTMGFQEELSAQLRTLTGERLAILALDELGWLPVLSPDESHALTQQGANALMLWKRTPGGFVETALLIGHEEEVSSASFSSDGSRIVTASWDGSARIWDLEGEERMVLRGHDAAVVDASFSKDGARVVTASWDGTARLWGVGGAALATLGGHEGPVYGAVFSPDGGRILTASRDGTARLWTAEGQPLAVLAGHVNAVLLAAYSPDGARIVTASEDDTAGIWDADGAPRLFLRGHWDDVQEAMFAPAGDAVLTVSGDGTARLWPIDPAVILRSLEVSPPRSFTPRERRRYADLLGAREE